MIHVDGAEDYLLSTDVKPQENHDFHYNPPTLQQASEISTNQSLSEEEPKPDEPKPEDRRRRRSRGRTTGPTPTDPKPTETPKPVDEHARETFGDGWGFGS